MAHQDDSGEFVWGLIEGLKHFYRLKLTKVHWSALSPEENFQSRMEFPTCC